MKLKIKKECIDKYTNEKYFVGRILEVDERRGEEILSSKHDVAEMIEEEPIVEEMVVDEKPKSKPKKKSEK